MKLVVVESPSKAKTIAQYVDKSFEVIASYGHIRALPSEEGSVLPDENFAMRFAILDKSKRNLDALIKKYKTCSELILATDQDREGEAISWHIREALKEKNVFRKDVPVKRVVFNEVTKPAVLEAIKNPRAIDERLVGAQQARQALDYLVGFTLSPVLWRKLPGSRSAGRVQSVALRIISERESEIEAFRAQEYWSIEGVFNTVGKEEFTAKLWVYDGSKLEKLSIANQAQAESAVAELRKHKYAVDSIEAKEIQKQPPPPFTTSTMLQEAARKLGFSAKKTSKLAQDLYEGIEVGGKSEGLITYMRTDSVSISPIALNATRSLIDSKYGPQYVPSKARFFKNKAKNAQEAHEAIRPTKVDLTPERVQGSLSTDHYKLYGLIWKRTVASQMSNAVLDSTAININDDSGKHVFRASGSTLKFDGFMKLYAKDKSAQDEALLPQVKAGEKLVATEIAPTQHFTEPPPRYTEASLVKKLEELGIGRPSTYPAIISVIQDRGYVTLEKKRFTAEPKGRIVSAFLTSFFSKYVEYGFTADLEDQLDQISNGALESKAVLQNFWKPFKARIDEVLLIKTSEVLSKMEEELQGFLFNSTPHQCDECKVGQMKLKTGKFGPFLGCSNYPNCKNVRRIVDASSDGAAEAESAAQGLPKELGEDADGRKYTIKRGPYGVYLEAVNGKDIKRVKIPTNKDLSSITIEYAASLASLPRVIGESTEFGIVKAGYGKFGPYVEQNGKYTSIRGADPITITLAEAEVFIKKKAQTGGKNAPKATRGTRAKRGTKATTKRRK